MVVDLGLPCCLHAVFPNGSNFVEVSAICMCARQHMQTMNRTAKLGGGAHAQGNRSHVALLQHKLNMQTTNSWLGLYHDWQTVWVLSKYILGRGGGGGSIPGVWTMAEEKGRGGRAHV